MIFRNSTDIISNEFDSCVICDDVFTLPYRGGTFNFNIFPKIPSERSLYDNDEITTLSATDDHIDGVVQVFKTNCENLNNIQLTLKGLLTPDVSIDDFSSYTSTSDLEDAYDTSDYRHLIPTLSNDSGVDRTKCLSLFVDRVNSKNDKLTHYLSLDIMDKTAIGFDIKTLKSSSNTYRFIIGDRHDEAYLDFQLTNVNIWEHKRFDLSSFTNIGMLDRTKIKYLRITCKAIFTTDELLIDSFLMSGNITKNTTKFKIYDFGDNPTFNNIGVQLPENQTDFFIDIDLNQTKKIVLVDLVNGVSSFDDLLLPDHYYGLYLEKPSEGTMTVFGSTTHSYTSGYAYHVLPDGSLSQLLGTFGFMTSVSSDSRLSSLQIDVDDYPADSKVHIFITDNDSAKTLFYAERTFHLQESIIIDFKDVLPEYVKISKSSNLSIYFSDASGSSVNEIHTTSKFYYNSLLVNG